MGAFRIFSRFAELRDINVSRAAATVPQLNTDGSVSEVEVTSAATANTIPKRDASGNASFSVVNSEGVATGSIDVTSSMSYGADATFIYTAGTSRANHLAALGALPAADGTATNLTLSTPSLTLSAGATVTCADAAAAIALRNAAGLGTTDNVQHAAITATTVTASGTVTVGAGSALAPSLHFGDVSTGFYRNSLNNISAALSGSRVFTLSPGIFAMQDLVGIGHSGLVFKPTVGGGAETQLCTGTIGNFRDLALRNLNASGTIKTGSYTTAAAIASSHATAVAAGDGAQSYISDIDKPVWSNGTVWKLADGTTLT